MTELTAARLREAAAEYESRAPFATVEQERLETLPDAFTTGGYHWRDAEWVVRWACRRDLEGGPRPRETAFRGNDFDDLECALEAAVTALANDRPRVALEALTELEGVDVQIASAFCHYIDPARYAVLDDSLWRTLAADGMLDEPAPKAYTSTAYERYLDACRTLAQREQLDVTTVTRGLWGLAEDEF